MNMLPSETLSPRRAWRARPDRSLLVALVSALLILGIACSSGDDSKPDSNPTPAGSGQIPVENPDGTGRPGSSVLTGAAREGLDSYKINGCAGCHSGENPGLGPTHTGVYETAANRVAGLSADEYITQSIREPSAFVVPGWDSPSPMPPFTELTDEEITNLIAYMKTLTIPEEQPAGAVTDLPPGIAENGRRLYGTIGCSGCHSLGSDRIVGPGFRGVAARAATRRPGLTADEYIYESITDPKGFIVEGFPSQMPEFEDLTDQDIADLLAFLKTVE